MHMWVLRKTGERRETSETRKHETVGHTGRALYAEDRRLQWSPIVFRGDE